MRVTTGKAKARYRTGFTIRPGFVLIQAQVRRVWGYFIFYMSINCQEFVAAQPILFALLYCIVSSFHVMVFIAAGNSDYIICHI
mgnify:FL=1